MSPSIPIEPDLLRPVLAATPRLNTVYRKPAEYRAETTGLVILDRFIPPQRPAADSIWIDPPADGSPIPVRSTVEHVALSQLGTPDHPATAGLRAKDFKLEKASVFEAAPDEQIGEVDAGPVIVARAGTPKIVVLGFHPGALRLCATSCPRRCSSPTCCAGCRRTFSGAGK